MFVANQRPVVSFCIRLKLERWAEQQHHNAVRGIGQSVPKMWARALWLGRTLPPPPRPIASSLCYPHFLPPPSFPFLASVSFCQHFLPGGWITGTQMYWYDQSGGLKLKVPPSWHQKISIWSVSATLWDAGECKHRWTCPQCPSKMTQQAQPAVSNLRMKDRLIEIQFQNDASDSLWICGMWI